MRIDQETASAGKAMTLWTNLAFSPLLRGHEPVVTTPLAVTSYTVASHSNFVYVSLCKLEF